MNVEDLGDLFEYELQGIYYVETELVDGLRLLAEQMEVDTLDETSDADFRDAVRETLMDHRRQTETHAERLEAGFDHFGREPRPRAVPALDGLFTEKERFNNVVLNDAARPLFYLDVAMKVEQLELRCYESLLRFADSLDLPSEVVEGLEANRDEDERTFRRLQELANGPETKAICEALVPEPPGS